jgi:hypothetical protein
MAVRVKVLLPAVESVTLVIITGFWASAVKAKTTAAELADWA